MLFRSIDKAMPPQLKYSPKRAVIILGMLFLFSFMFVPFVFAGEKAVNRETFQNPLQNKVTNFYKKVAKFYRMKL